MQNYLDLLRDVRQSGQFKADRTGVGTYSRFGAQLRFDLAAGFPLVTSKKVHFPAVVHELIWFLSGETNIRYLKDNKVRIWDEWADAEGNLGPVYGAQWRAWQTARGESIDQMAQVVEQIKTNPDSRRLIVSAWNVGQIPEMALAPCHALFQFYVAPALPGQRRALSCQLYQRSADMFLGVPFNIASYALLTHLVAAQCDLAVGEFVWTAGDYHVYQNHLAQVDLQLTRSPLPLPQIALLRQPASLFDYHYADIELRNYQSHALIAGKVAV
jgi:thymidylate synthase